jgi:hypothetical protein
VPVSVPVRRGAGAMPSSRVAAAGFIRATAVAAVAMAAAAAVAAAVAVKNRKRAPKGQASRARVRGCSKEGTGMVTAVGVKVATVPSI